MEPTKRFRIAFSFAGEKRDFVKQVAAILAGRFGEERILYDMYHEAEFSRARLGRYLPKLYHEQSELVVAVFCRDYATQGVVRPGMGRDLRPAQATARKRSDAQQVRPRDCRRALLGHRLYRTGQQVPGAVCRAHSRTPRAQRRQAQRPLPKRTLPEDRAHHTSIPNNLPRLQPFFGRETELAQIREALDPDNRTWGALIDGPGGMGKTSLAVRAAYDCTPEQFKRIVFVSVKNRELDDDGVRELRGFILPGFLEMLNELSRELERPDIPKAPEDQRIRLLLEALRDEQVLLILDNLESLTKADRDQLLTFVERLPQGCKAILTSRRRIGSGSKLLILQRLDQGAALETLADLAQHNPLLAKTGEDERIALYEQTAGNPLLLRWVAGQIGRGSCRTFTDALNFLRSCPEDNDPLEFVFGDLVNEFSEAETKLLCALTYFNLPAKVEHIAAAAGCDEEPAETALRSLANRSLVVPDTEETAFALVPMVADFLRRQKPAIIAETGDRLEKQAYSLMVENGYEKFDNFHVLDAAWPVVASSLPHFLAGTNDQLQTACSALTNFLNFTGRWDEWRTLSRDAEAKAVAAEDFHSAGWRAYEVGAVHLLRGQSVEVLAYADRAESHWHQGKAGTRERAVAIRLRGKGQLLSENYSAAIAAYREAVEIDRTLRHESIDVVIGLNDLAEVELRSGDDEAAKRDFREALRIALAVKYHEGIAYTINNLAVVEQVRGNWSGAEALAHKALLLSDKVGRQELIAGSYHNLAVALAQQGRKPEALPHAQRAVEIFTVLRSRHLEKARQTLAECEG